MRFYFLVLCMAAGCKLFAQQTDRRQADSLLKALDKTPPGPDRAKTLLRLAEFHVFKPGESKTDLDSARVFLEQADHCIKPLRSPALSGHYLLTKAFMLRENGQEAEGRKAVEQAIPLLEKGGNPYHLGKACFELAGYYDWLDSAELSQRLLLTRKAANAFEQAGELEEKAHALRMLGDLYGANTEYSKGIEVLNEALAVYNQINHQQLQGVYELMSRFYSKSGDYKRSMQYGLLALKTAQLMRDSSMQLAAINNTIATLYRQAGRKDIAIKYYQDALATVIRHNDISGTVLVVYNIGLLYIDLKQAQKALALIAAVPAKLLDDPHPIGQAWVAIVNMRAHQMEQHAAEAHQYAMFLERLLLHPDLSQGVRDMVHVALANYYLKAQILKKARFHLTKSLSSTPPAISQASADRFRLLYKIDSAERKLPAAFEHLNTYKTISDSLFDEVKSRQFQQLEVEFETSKKSDSITLLTQKNALQTASLREADLVKNVTIAGIVLTVAIISLLYRQYRQKQRNSTLMAQKNERLERLINEKEWLLKEVHHRVKNNLQTIISLLELQSGSLDKDVQFALQTSQHRIYATSLLHQKLYRQDNVSSVNMNIYLTELVDYLREAYGASSRILFRTEVAPIELDVTQGVPLGLIVNEAVTNSLKYAFADDGGEPELMLSLAMAGGMAQLRIRDNGAGFDTGNNPAGLGLKLIKGLAEDIDGEASILSDNGTCITVRFKPRAPLNSVLVANDQDAMV